MAGEEGSGGGLQKRNPQRLALCPWMSKKHSRLYPGSASNLQHGQSWLAQLAGTLSQIQRCICILLLKLYFTWTVLVVDYYMTSYFTKVKVDLTLPFPEAAERHGPQAR